MCGRFTLTTPASAFARAFGVEEPEPTEPRFNVAPTQEVFVIRWLDGERHVDRFRWGFLPAWAKDPKGHAPINARAETLAEKPMFRGAFKHKRCLVPADGFYEWLATGGKKQPVYFQMKDGHPFAFAGLWSHWEGQGQQINSFTLLTTEPNRLVEKVHDRMPVILHPADYDRWLDPAVQATEALLPLLRPYEAEAMTSRWVSPAVNSARVDVPDLIAPYTPAPEDGGPAKAPNPQQLKLF